MAPLVVDDIVIVGVAGADEGIRGFVAAFQPDTGALVWRRWTVPQRGEPGDRNLAATRNPSPAAAPPGSPAPTIPPSDTLYLGHRQSLARLATTATVPATTSTPTASSRSIPKPATSSGTTSSRLTT